MPTEMPASTYCSGSMLITVPSCSAAISAIGSPNRFRTCPRVSPAFTVSQACFNGRQRPCVSGHHIRSHDENTKHPMKFKTNRETQKQPDANQEKQRDRERTSTDKKRDTQEQTGNEGHRRLLSSHHAPL